jgi:hypothetical protein
MHFDALEVIVRGRDEDPVAVMQVQHGRRGYDWVNFIGFALEGRSNKHSQPQNAGIHNFDADFGSTYAGIEHWTNVADATSQHLVGKGAKFDLCGLSELKLWNIVLVDVANDPNNGKISDGEGGGGSRVSYTGRRRVGDVLRHNDTGDWRITSTMLDG